jgi:hypothetical protein
MGGKQSKIASAVGTAVDTASARAAFAGAAAARSPSKPAEAGGEGPLPVQDYDEALKLMANAIHTRPSPKPATVNTNSVTRPLPRRGTAGAAAAAMPQETLDTPAAILALLEENDGLKKYYQKLYVPALAINLAAHPLVLSEIDSFKISTTPPAGRLAGSGRPRSVPGSHQIKTNLKSKSGTAGSRLDAQ